LRRKSENSNTKSETRLELRRQLVHAAGILVVPVILFMERQAATVTLGGILLLLIIMSFYRAKKKFQAKWLEDFVLKRERPGEFPLSGSVFFFLGTFCAFLLYQPLYAAAAAAVLALGDSASTVVGKLYGKHKLPFGGRSWEGSLAFFAFSFAVLLLFVQPQKAAVVAALAALVEMIPKLDDNFTIPIAAGLFLTLL